MNLNICTLMGLRYHIFSTHSPYPYKLFPWALQIKLGSGCHVALEDWNPLLLWLIYDWAPVFLVFLIYVSWGLGVIKSVPSLLHVESCIEIQITAVDWVLSALSIMVGEMSDTASAAAARSLSTRFFLASSCFLAKSCSFFFFILMASSFAACRHSASCFFSRLRAISAFLVVIFMMGFLDVRVSDVRVVPVEGEPVAEWDLFILALFGLLILLP